MKMILEKVLMVLTALLLVCVVGFSISLVFNTKKTDVAEAYVDSNSKAIATQMAEEGIILLKNDYSCLPLKPNMVVGGYGEGQTGETSTTGGRNEGYQFGGGGSGWVCATGTVNPYEGLIASVNAGRLSAYNKISSTTTGSYDRVLYFVTRYSAEDSDLVEADYYLTSTEKNEISSLIQTFGKENVVVILNIPAVMDTTWLIEKDVGAIVVVWMAGQEAGTAIANVLTGVATPSGKTADTWAKSLTDYPTTANFSNPHMVKYEEDLYLGYRWFETFDKNYEKVNYEFGYGLSYTNFDIRTTAVKIDKDEGVINVYVTVQNVGNTYSGKEVVQVYYSTPDFIIDAPAKQLVAFEKTKLLAPQEAQNLVLTININDMSQFDDTGIIQKNAYVFQPGDYTLFVGNSVKDAGKRGFVAKYTVDEPTVVQQCNELSDSKNSLDKRLTSDGSYETLLDYTNGSVETHYYSGYGSVVVDATALHKSEAVNDEFYKNNGLRAFWHENYSCFTYYTGFSSNTIIRQLKNEFGTVRLFYKLYVEKAGTYNIDFYVSNEYADQTDLLDVQIDYVKESNEFNGKSTGIVVASHKQSTWKDIERVSGNTITFDKAGYALIAITPKHNCGLESFVIYNNQVSQSKETVIPAVLSSNRPNTTEEIPASGVGHCIGNLKNGYSVDFVVNAETAGKYYLSLYAANSLLATSNFASVSVNGNVQNGSIALMRTAPSPFLGGASTDSWWKYADSSSVLIDLAQGQNTIKLTVTHRAGDAYTADQEVTFVNLHSIKLRPESLGARPYTYRDNTADFKWIESTESPYASNYSTIYTYTDVIQGKISVEDYVKQFDVYELAGLAINNVFKNDSATNVGGIGGLPSYDDYANAYGNEAIWNNAKGVTTIYGLPYASMADGPAGVHFRLDLGNSNLNPKFHYATYFPCMTMLASTWNKQLAYEFGVTYGKEANEVGVTIALMPGVNIHRNPLCGRNFEYFSEDPFVAGWMATYAINGVQSTGVLTSIKHYATNNQETNRFSNDSRVSERALREIYLEAFRIAVLNANPGTVMNSYNHLNGKPTAESYDLNTAILRNEWGYEGTIESDWGFWHYDTVSGLIAGTNVRCFGNTVTDLTDIVKAYQQGKISYDKLVENASFVVKTLISSSAESTGVPQSPTGAAQTSRADKILSCSDGSGTTWHYLSTLNVTQQIGGNKSSMNAAIPSGIFGTAKLESHNGATYLSNLNEESGAYYAIFVKETGVYKLSYKINVGAAAHNGHYGNFSVFVDGVKVDTFTNPNHIVTAGKDDWYTTGILFGDSGEMAVNLEVGLHRIFIDSNGSYYNLHEIIFTNTKQVSEQQSSFSFNELTESSLVDKVDGASVFTSVSQDSGLKFTLKISDKTVVGNTKVIAVLCPTASVESVTFENYASTGFRFIECAKTESGNDALYLAEFKDIAESDYSTSYTVKYFIVSSENGITIVKQALSDARSCKQVATALIANGYPKGKIEYYLK